MLPQPLQPTTVPAAADVTAGKIDGMYLKRHYAAIVEFSDDAIISKDLNGIIQSWNNGAQKIFGYTAEEMVGKSIRLLIPQNLQGEETTILERIGRGERVDHYETVRQRKDGTLASVSLTISPIKDDDGTIVGASKIARDITEHKRSEEVQRHFSAIIESSDDAILSKDLNGIIQSWNKGAERIFGYTAAEVVGKSVTILIPPEREDEEPKILGRVRKGERVEHYETIRKTKDGTLLHVSLTVSPIKDKTGKIVGASKIARNITEAKEAGEMLKQTRSELARTNAELEERVKARTASLNEAVAQMQEFSYTVSHDLRGPVRAMQGYATAVLEGSGAQLEPMDREYLQRIIRGSNRMDKLIKDVLVYSRLAQSQIVVKPVSMNHLMSEIIQQYPDMQHPHVEISVDGPLAPVLGHESSLTQALSNLLNNAKKFVAAGTVPKIKIWTEKRGSSIRLWIKDNGIGIKPEYQARLFGMFERMDKSEQYEGTGIGLAIVRKAIEKMGGTVGMESDGVQGSAFWLELPTAE